MYSNEERKQVRQQLDRELNPLRMPESVRERVIQSVLTPKESYWHRKVSCPAPLFGALAAAVIGCAAFFVLFPADTDALPPPSMTKRIILDSGIFVESDLQSQQVQDNEVRRWRSIHDG